MAKRYNLGGTNRKIPSDYNSWFDYVSVKLSRDPNRSVMTEGGPVKPKKEKK